MKNVGLLILGIILGASAMYFYSDGTEGEPEALALIKPKGVITPAEAKILNDNWSKKPKLLLDSIAGRPDNRSAWWSTDDILKYISYAENQTDSLGYKMSGLRLYFGVYPNTAPRGKADYSTIFMVPTGKKKKSDASVLPTNFLQGGDRGDIGDADPLNNGTGEIPPGSGYGG